MRVFLCAAALGALLALAAAKVTLETTEQGATFDVATEQDVFVKRGSEDAFGLAASHADVEARLAALEEGDPALDGLDGRLQSLESFVNNHANAETRLQSVEATLNGGEGAAGIVDRVEALETFKSEHPNAETRLQAVEETLEGLDGIDTRVGELEEEVRNITRRLAEAGGQQCNSEDIDVSLLGLRVASLSAAVDGLFARLDNALVKTVDAYARIRDLSGLQSRLSALQSSALELEAQMNGLSSLKTESSSIANSVTTTLPAVTDPSALVAKANSLLARLDALEQVTALPYTECALGQLDSQVDTGRVTGCTFTKKYDNSVLKLTWRGDLRVICSGCEQRWYMAVDSQECKVPIDGTLHENSNTDNHHRVSTLTGFCPLLADGSTIRAGQHSLDFFTQTRSGSADAYTGWSSASSLIIVEYPPRT